jgi:hypothetical protein
MSKAPHIELLTSSATCGLHALNIGERAVRLRSGADCRAPLLKLSARCCARVTNICRAAKKAIVQPSALRDEVEAAFPPSAHRQAPSILTPCHAVAVVIASSDEAYAAPGQAGPSHQKMLKNPFAAMDDSVLLMDELELSNHSKSDLLVFPDEASPSDLARTVWAFAACRQHHGGLLTKLARRLTAHPNGWWLDGSDISRLAWAYAILGVRNKMILELVTHRGMLTLPDMTPSEVARLIGSFGALILAPADPNLLPAALAQHSIQSYYPSELVSICWSIAAVGVFRPQKPVFARFFSSVAALASENVDTDVFRWRQLADLATALSIYRYEFSVVGAQNGHVDRIDNFFETVCSNKGLLEDMCKQNKTIDLVPLLDCSQFGKIANKSPDAQSAVIELIRGVGIDLAAGRADYQNLPKHFGRFSPIISHELGFQTSIVDLNFNDRFLSDARRELVLSLGQAKGPWSPFAISRKREHKNKEQCGAMKRVLPGLPDRKMITAYIHADVRSATGKEIKLAKIVEGGGVPSHSETHLSPFGGCSKSADKSSGESWADAVWRGLALVETTAHALIAANNSQSRSITNRIDAGEAKGWAGSVILVLPNYPNIQSLQVAGQFAKLFPGVRLELVVHDWGAWRVFAPRTYNTMKK